MKTAMRELILKLPNEFIADNPSIILELLIKEKEQIMTAYSQGLFGEETTDSISAYSKQYYNKTYNNEKD